MHTKLEILTGGDFVKKQYKKVLDLYITRHRIRYGVTYSPFKEYLLKNHHFATQNYIYHKKAITFILYIGNEIAAFMSGVIIKQGIYIVPRLSIDEKYKFYSPGILLINDVVRYFSQTNDLNVNAIDLSEEKKNTNLEWEGLNITHIIFQ